MKLVVDQGFAKCEPFLNKGYKVDFTQICTFKNTWI